MNTKGKYLHSEAFQVLLMGSVLLDTVVYKDVRYFSALRKKSTPEQRAILF